MLQSIELKYFGSFRIGKLLRSFGGCVASLIPQINLRVMHRIRLRRKVFRYQQKKTVPALAETVFKIILLMFYIIPGIPPPIGGMAGAAFSSLCSTKTHSVVSNIPAIEAAFSSAMRATFVGSITPASKRFS